MMAAGKTTLGKIVAQRYNMEFVDTDSIIENKNSMSISEIFEKKGEPFFRAEEEKQVLKWYDLFVDYISDQDKNLYNEACEYADKNE